ncbi:hypothetical protein AB4323_21330 [Vibrio sp. 10N.261.52.C11]|uniref:hypothetical protein n=1 Tax=unclassified Vibrio TaxID=2614977 RepID=UPI00354F2696
MKLEEKLVISIYCVVLISFGFLLATALFFDLDGVTSSDILSGLGSLLSGIGTLGLLWFGCETYSDWKSSKSNEAAFVLYRDLFVFKYKLMLLIDNIVKSGGNPRLDLQVEQSFKELDSHIDALVFGSSQFDSLVKISDTQWFLAHTHALRNRVRRLMNLAFSEHLNSTQWDAKKLNLRSEVVKSEQQEMNDMLQKMERKLNSMGFNPTA